MVQKLNHNDFLLRAAPPLIKLCGSISPDPFGVTFTDKVECWRILYSYTLFPSDELMGIIKKCVNQCYGENEFFISHIYGEFSAAKMQLEGYSLTFDEYIENTWEIISSIVIENVIYSPSGQWGIVSSDEFHAVIGGSSEFINCLREEIPDLDDQVYGFLKLWAGYAEHYDLEIKWMPEFMYWMYGEEKGKQMLMENGLSFLYESRPAKETVPKIEHPLKKYWDITKCIWSQMWKQKCHFKRKDK